MSRWYYRVLLILAVLVLAGGVFSAGVVAERTGVLPGAIAYEPRSVAPTFSIFWEAWGLVQKYYVDRAAVKPVPMTYGAIEGMLDSLGDVGHTRFLSPEMLREEETALAGKFEGIGADLNISNGRPTVLAPIPGSPAQRSGLRPGDVIVRVDGKEVAGLKLDQIISMIKGPVGTAVTLTVIHPGETTLTDIKIVRAKITVSNVSWARVPGTNDAHVLVSQFGDNCTEQLVAALNAAR